MELLKYGERSAWWNKTGFGKVTSMELNGDEITIKLTIDIQGKETLQNFNFEKGDRVGDFDFNTFNIYPEAMTKERIFNILSGHPLVEWATGKVGYKMYCNGLDGIKLY